MYKYIKIYSHMHIYVYYVQYNTIIYKILYLVYIKGIHNVVNVSSHTEAEATLISRGQRKFVFVFSCTYYRKCVHVHNYLYL